MTTRTILPVGCVPSGRTSVTVNGRPPASSRSSPSRCWSPRGPRHLDGPSVFLAREGVHGALVVGEAQSVSVHHGSRHGSWTQRRPCAFPHVNACSPQPSSVFPPHRCRPRHTRGFALPW